MEKQDNYQTIKDIVRDIWGLKLHVRKLMYHRNFALYTGYLFFFFSYFIIPVLIFILLVSGISRIALGFNVLSYIVDLFDYKIWRYILGSIFLVYVLIYYIFIIRYPRCPKNKIGIGVAFTYDLVGVKKLKAALYYRDQIVRELEKVLDQEKFGHLFKIIKINDYHANRFYKKFTNRFLAHKYTRKTNIIFTIYGYVKNEKYDAKNQYKYELEYLVGHKTVPINISQLMSRKFSKHLHSQKWEFEENNSGKMLEGVANNIRENAYFAIGISSFYSQNPILAITFLDKLLGNSVLRPDLELYAKNHLAFSHLSIAQVFTNNKIGQDWLNIAFNETEKAVKFKPNYYDAYILLSVLHYKNKKIDEALNALKEAQRYQCNAVWRFNEAFLHFYLTDQKNLEEGLRIYKNIKNKHIGTIDKAIFHKQIIPSLLEAITDEQKNQFYFSLIFVYAKVLGDKGKAIEYYNLFLDKGKNNTDMKILLDAAEKLITN
ncbi:hypothetical protein JW977_02110 [Candidatus Falkowbacteria bacterium]|nr:hypothetical protein [Candidatus Falkowbacteria bacterium]